MPETIKLDDGGAASAAPSARCELVTLNANRRFLGLPPLDKLPPWYGMSLAERCEAVSAVKP